MRKENNTSVEFNIYSACKLYHSNLLCEMPNGYDMQLTCFSCASCFAVFNSNHNMNLALQNLIITFSIAFYDSFLSVFYDKPF